MMQPLLGFDPGFLGTETTRIQPMLGPRNVRCVRTCSILAARESCSWGRRRSSTWRPAHCCRADASRRPEEDACRWVPEKQRMGPEI